MSRASLDVNAATIIGEELDSLRLPNEILEYVFPIDLADKRRDSPAKTTILESFHECLRKISEQGAGLGPFKSFADAQVTLRSWLPLEANKDLSRADRQVRTVLRTAIRQRIRDIEFGKVRTSKDEYESGKPGRDLLTFLIEDQLASGELGRLTEDEIVDQVSLEIPPTVLNYSAIVPAAS